MASDEAHTNEDFINKKSRSHLIVKIKPRAHVKNTLSHVRVKKIPSSAYIKKAPSRMWVKMRAPQLEEPSSHSSRDSVNELAITDDYISIDKSSLEEDNISEIIVLFESIIALLESSLARPKDEIILIQ